MRERAFETEMQTHLTQRDKKNKITVPFYSPPFRLQGQTSAEIIKEARAAVMNTPAAGIKPVFTSRPFTPKEKERTLFGNVRKRSERPPSSFSLRNLQSQEIGSRVKLPSINVASKRKTYTTFHYLNNLSLDNLTEDYDAEVLEELGGSVWENLPERRKSHSCPKEGRLVKAASCNELNHHSLSVSGVVKDGCRLGKTKRQYDIDLRKCDADALRPENFKENVGDTEVDYSRKVLNIFSATAKGDFQRVECFGGNSLPKGRPEDKVEQLFGSLEKGDSNMQIDQQRNLQEKKRVIVAEDNKIEEKKGKVEILQKEKSNDQQKIIKNSKMSLEQMVRKELNEHIKQEEKVETESEEKKVSVVQGFVDKSVTKDPKSEYLSYLEERKSNIGPKQDVYVPAEIIELYETANYYGVDVNDKLDSKTPKSKEEPQKSLEDYFGEKSNDYLNDLKKNFYTIDGKIKPANETVDKIQAQKYQKDGTTTCSTQMPVDNKEFVMNNKKRYHVVSKKGEAKEKAYKKWNNKQEAVNRAPERAPTEGWDLFWKNAYFKNEDTENKEDKVNVEKEAHVQSLVNKIIGLDKKGAGDHEILDATRQLFNVIKGSNVILDRKLKEKVVKALYMYADSEDPEVLSSLAKLLLYLKEESNLSAACKMIFKVARFDANDYLFLNEEDLLELFLEGIGRASPLDCAESCVYGYGALKFLTMNYNILSRILHLGALDLMTLHLKMINNAHCENGKVGEHTQHALFQLTGALRHVAAGEGALPLFITTKCIPIVCKTLQLFQNDEDIVTNISRTLSLLSTDESVIAVLMSIENILIVVIDLIERYKLNDKILIRLAFCLGNIVEHSDLARVQLSRSDASLSVLLNILTLYIDKDLEVLMKDDKNEKSDGLDSQTIDDIIVKVIRIIANMSMNPIVGSNLSPTTNEKKSIQLSKLLSVLLMRKDPGMTLLATLGCLNNISYYSSTHSVLIDITQGIARVLELQSEDCQAEAARVLGNLTRHKEIRDLMYTTGGINKLIKLLTSQDQEVVRCACGALVNMMLDENVRRQFIEAQGIDKLVKALEVFYGDWSLASLAARAMWNSCVNDVSSAMLHNNVEHLLNILANSLEEENWNDGDSAWEEYASIATDLLEKLNSHLDST